MKVGALGPRGTHSEIAVWSQFKSRAEIVLYSTISDVVEAVARGEVDAGVIPVESLREGSVGESLDALTWADVKIKGEIVLPITHALLAVKGAKIEQITQVLSHPQAIAQCRAFLRNNLPMAEIVEMGSTARAAEQVSKLGKPHIAAIGPRMLAKLYNLQVLKGNIQRDEKNLTRFWLISKEDSRRTSRDKTSIVFYTADDRPGILHEILGEFAARKINLTKIESRPSKKALGDYLFFVDLEGHREDNKVKEALKEIEKKTAMLRVLGSYPRKF
ncbi:MAG: prephenate dehydratase [Candidatus Hadarchaeaceae archaeon]